MTLLILRRMLALLALVVLVSPAVGSVQAPLNRAGLVVQYGDGRVDQMCIEFSEPEITGIDLLRRSGLDIKIEEGSGMGAAVCEIGGVGCDFPNEACFCQATRSPYRYWSLYNSEGTTWVYSGVGASSTRIRDGSAQAWVWGSSTSQRGAGPPDVSPTDVCAVPTAQPIPTPRPSATAVPSAPPTATAAPTRQAPIATPPAPPTRTFPPPTATRRPTSTLPAPSATARPRPSATTRAVAPTAAPPTHALPTTAPTRPPTALPSPTVEQVVVPTATARPVATRTLAVVPSATSAPYPVDAPTASPVVVPTRAPLLPTPTGHLNAAAESSAAPLPSSPPLASPSVVASADATPAHTVLVIPTASEPLPTATLQAPTAAAPTPSVLIAGGEQDTSPREEPRSSLPLDPLAFVALCAVLVVIILQLRRRQGMSGDDG